MNAQQQLWAGEFGAAYTARNRVDWRARIAFWRTVMDWTGARSVYEVGCNAGWNLSAIRREYPDVALYGHDVNENAAREAVAAGLTGVYHTDLFPEDQHELVFTAGVLIHVAPENLQPMMTAIVAASCHFVLAVEYFAPDETEVEYRGEMGRLWKRPYGNLYERMGLELVDSGMARGFDRCHYWLLEKR